MYKRKLRSYSQAQANEEEEEGTAPIKVKKSKNVTRVLATPPNVHPLRNGLIIENICKRLSLPNIRSFRLINHEWDNEAKIVLRKTSYKSIVLDKSKKFAKFNSDFSHVGLEDDLLYSRFTLPLRLIQDYLNPPPGPQDPLQIDPIEPINSPIAQFLVKFASKIHNLTLRLLKENSFKDLLINGSISTTFPNLRTLKIVWDESFILVRNQIKPHQTDEIEDKPGKLEVPPPIIQNLIKFTTSIHFNQNFYRILFKIAPKLCKMSFPSNDLFISDAHPFLYHLEKYKLNPPQLYKLKFCNANSSTIEKLLFLAQQNNLKVKEFILIYEKYPFPSSCGPMIVQFLKLQGPLLRKFRILCNGRIVNSNGLHSYALGRPLGPIGLPLDVQMKSLRILEIDIGLLLHTSAPLLFQESFPALVQLNLSCKQTRLNTVELGELHDKFFNDLFMNTTPLKSLEELEIKFPVSDHEGMLNLRRIFPSLRALSLMILQINVDDILRGLWTSTDWQNSLKDLKLDIQRGLGRRSGCKLPKYNNLDFVLTGIDRISCNSIRKKKKEFQIVKNGKPSLSQLQGLVSLSMEGRFEITDLTGAQVLAQMKNLQHFTASPSPAHHPYFSERCRKMLKHINIKGVSLVQHAQIYE